MVLLVYSVTKGFPKTEDYSLTNQMRRAAASVTANIAEGFGRKTYKEKLQFYYLAQGSLTELKNFVLISKDVGYLSASDFDRLLKQSNLTHQLLQGFLQKTKTFINHKS